VNAYIELTSSGFSSYKQAMQLVIIDGLSQTRAILLGRISEAFRQAGLKDLQPLELDASKIETFDWNNACGCLLGPGCMDGLDELVERVRLVFPHGLLGAVVETEVYASQAVTLRRKLNLQIMPLGDVAQIAGFLIDCEASTDSGGQGKGRAIIGICHLKGGVGATTITAALAACWARHGLSVAALDFDDVNPQLTAWGRVGLVQRTVTAELLRQGEVPAQRVNELVNPVEGFEGRLVIVGQPEAYNEGFHFKANVLDGSPSASEFVRSLIDVLKDEFDAIIIDMGRSWGIASFAALPLCQQVILVTDDDGMSVRRTLDCFARLRKESDDPEEFDLSRWSLILNGYTGQLISPKEIALEIQEMDLFSAQSSLYTVPFSEKGRQWGAPGQSFYDAAEPKTQHIIRRIACNLVPFRYEPEVSALARMTGKLRALIHRQ